MLTCCVLGGLEYRAVPPNLESSESLPTQNRIIGGGGEHELVGADETRSGKSPVDEEATVPSFLKSTGCTGHKPAVASVSLLAPNKNYGGGRELELAGAGRRTCLHNCCSDAAGA